MKRVVAGPRAVTELLRGRRGAVSVVFMAEGKTGEQGPLRALAQQASVPVEHRPAEDLTEIAGDLRHQGVIAIAGAYPYAGFGDLVNAAPPESLLVALDQVTDPYNFGAIVRSAVALGARGVITLKNRAAPVTPTVVRASAGATEQARIARVTNLSRALEQLAETGHEIIGLAGDGTARLVDLPPAQQPRVLVIGSEGRGIRAHVRKRCHLLARIDLAGPIHSLNASVAAGIAIHDLLRQA